MILMMVAMGTGLFCTSNPEVLERLLGSPEGKRSSGFRHFLPYDWLSLRTAVPMLIRLGYDIQFEIPAVVAMVGVLHVHPSRVKDLREPDELTIDPELKIESYLDSYGNRCSRFLAPAGRLQITNSTWSSCRRRTVSAAEKTATMS